MKDKVSPLKLKILLPCGVAGALCAIFLLTSSTNTYFCQDKACIRVIVYEDLFGVRGLFGKKNLNISLMSFASKGAPTIKRSGKTNFLGHYIFNGLPLERDYTIHLLDYAEVGGDAVPCLTLQDGNINLAHYYQATPLRSTTINPTGEDSKHTIFIALKTSSLYRSTRFPA